MWKAVKDVLGKFTEASYTPTARDHIEAKTQDTTRPFRKDAVRKIVVRARLTQYDTEDPEIFEKVAFDMNAKLYEEVSKYVKLDEEETESGQTVLVASILIYKEEKNDKAK